LLWGKTHHLHEAGKMPTLPFIESTKMALITCHSGQSFFTGSRNS
jgi:hypothetical protein